MRILIAIPACNETPLLEKSIERLVSYIKESLSEESVHIIIAENGSTDETLTVANALARGNANVSVVSTGSPGRGKALKEAWTKKEADVYLYIDADLPYELSILKEITDAIRNGADVAVASRWAEGAKNSQVPYRQFGSKLYNRFLRFLFKTQLTDFQAGAKGINAKARNVLLRENNETGWFFDTLLLLEAERRGLSVVEIPAVCVDQRHRLPVISGIIYFIQKPLMLKIHRLFRGS
jgi:glycosyltransferase involved in cell wall biosynthesis